MGTGFITPYEYLPTFKSTFEPKSTGFCDAKGCHNKANFHCSKCQVNIYCSKSCQVKHWPVHKEKCVIKFKNTCHNWGCINPGRYKCSSCNDSYYCSKGCQLERWEEHKLECKRKN